MRHVAVLPAATSTGTYTIQVVYNGSADFLGSTDTSHSLTVNPATTFTAAASTSATFSTAGQTVPLTAAVTSAAGTVNVGTETFTILSGTTMIGSAVTVNVGNGTAAASYVLPGMTPTGNYTIQSAYNGSADFLGSTDTSHILNVSTVATSTAAASTSATFSPASQSVPLTATVSSAAGIVSEGTETFTILNGMTVIGPAVTVDVDGGLASASYVLPGGTSIRNYTIRAVYNGTGDFLGSTDTSHSLIVNPGAAYQIVFGQQPTNAVAGVAISSAVTVKVEDQYHNVVTADNSTVTLTLSSGTFEGGSSKVTAVASSGTATFSGLKTDVAGPYTLSATDLTLNPSGASDRFTIAAAAATQLVVTTPAPNSIIAGQAFNVVVSAEDHFHNLASNFNGNLTVALANNPGASTLGGITTVAAVDGVATFSNLTLTTGSGYTLHVFGDGPTSITTTPFDVTPTPTPTPTPTIIGEQVVMMQKKNKKGKPVGKPVLLGFTLDYSTAMNPATAGLTANYQVASTTTKRVKKNIVTVFKPVALTAAYNPSNNSVTLSIQGKPTFAKGGQIKVIYSPPSGVSSEAGIPLDASDTEFTILPKATRVTPG